MCDNCPSPLSRPHEIPSCFKLFGSPSDFWELDFSRHVETTSPNCTRQRASVPEDFEVKPHYLNLAEEDNGFSLRCCADQPDSALKSVFISGVRPHSPSSGGVPCTLWLCMIWLGLLPPSQGMQLVSCHLFISQPHRQVSPQLFLAL